MQKLSQLNVAIENYTINDESSTFKFVTTNQKRALFLQSKATSFFKIFISLNHSFYITTSYVSSPFPFSADDLASLTEKVNYRREVS